MLLATLFFMWGFLTSLNDILIPYFKQVFGLSHFQSMLVQSAFFGAYFVGSLLYFVTSTSFGDPIARIGYQRGAVLGLVLSGLGALAMIPASLALSYPFFLGALFTIGLGFTLLQISANPYVIAIGEERTASSRLNLCQGLNSVGTTLGPLIGGGLIFRVFHSEEAGPTEGIRLPYLALAGMMFALAVFIARANLPRLHTPGTIQRGAAVLKRPHVLLGILTIFCYVGAEVSIGSIMIGFLGLDRIGGLDETDARVFVSLYWGGLMIGRFLGAISISDLPARTKGLSLGLVPLVGFLYLAFLVERGRELDYGEALVLMLPFAGFLALNVGAFLLGASKPGRTTGVFALCAVALLSVTILADGSLALWCLVAVGLFNSIMWSNVFALSIEGLGKQQSQASSLLVMAIVGGALLPPLQGELADLHGIQYSFLVPLVAYLYIAFYGFRGQHIGRTRTAVAGAAEEEGTV